MSDNGHQRQQFEFDDFRLYPHERLLVRNSKPIALTPRVLDLLIVLVRHDGELVRKEELLDSIWADSFVEEGNISRAVSTLRKNLGVQSDGRDFIETVPKLGYRFIAPVHESLDSVPKAVRSQAGRKLIWLATGGVLVLIAVLAFYLWRSAGSVAVAKTSPTRLTDDPLHDSIPRWTSDGRIRFFRTDGKDWGTMIMNADGTGQTVSKAVPLQNGGLWSPDGTKAIFRKLGDKTSVYLANSDGTNEVVLPFQAGNLDWSADSRSVVYQGKGPGGDADIFTYSLETGMGENVTRNPAFDADPSFSPDGKQIVFASTRDGNAEIYLINADGSNIRRLTNLASWDNHPVFSPDGTSIAFNSDREGENSDVYIMQSDGSDVRRLTDSKHNESVEPGCWSPDGTQIAFYSDEFGNDDIFVTNAEVFHPRLIVADDTSDLVSGAYSPDGQQIVYQSSMPDKKGELRLFDLQSKQSRSLLRTENTDILPVYSPDGTQIAFQNRIDSNTEICLIRLDGTGLLNLTNNPAKDGGPVFSPDGTQIAFASNRDGNTGIFHIYLMDANGGDQHRVDMAATGSQFLPAWWPDGTTIVFTNDADGTGNFEISKLRLAAGEAEQQLTFRPRYDSQPSVSPDGKLIAFSSNTDGNTEIYLMNSDGTNLRRLSRNPSEDMTPKFSPDGSRILFSSDRGGRYAIYEIAVSP